MFSSPRFEDLGDHDLLRAHPLFKFLVVDDSAYGHTQNVISCEPHSPVVPEEHTDALA
jgi:hypothetical protein